MFWKNTQRRVDAAGLLLAHAKAKGITNAAKSSYYRSASILLATVAEGMVYELVKKHTSPPHHAIGDTVDHKERHKISARIFSTSGDLVICEKMKRDILIADDGVGFGKLNVYLKNRKHVSQPEYRLLDWVRKERNRIHLQGLNSSDIGYTKAKIEKISKAIILLTRKLT